MDSKQWLLRISLIAVVTGTLLLAGYNVFRVVGEFGEHRRDLVIEESRDAAALERIAESLERMEREVYRDGEKCDCKLQDNRNTTLEPDPSRGASRGKEPADATRKGVVSAR